MKKVILFCSVVLIAFCSSSLFCMDFGGYLDNKTSFSTDESVGFYQIARLSLWLKTNLSDHWQFSILGHYIYELDYPYLVDIDSCVMEAEWPFVENGPSRFSLQLGRFRFSEFSHLVLDHPADGFYFTFDYPSSVFSLGFGYTGIISKHSTTITLSKADTNDQDDPGVILGTPRLLGIAQWHLPEIFGGHDLYLSALLQKDLHAEKRIISEGEEAYSLAENRGGYYDSIYTGAGLSGAFTSFLFYKAFGYFQTGRTLFYTEDENSITGFSYQYTPIYAFLGGFDFTFYAESLSYSVFTISFVYSSGDTDSISCVEGNQTGPSFLFTPLSQTEQQVIFNPRLSNIFYIQGNYTIKPLALAGKGLVDRVLLILEGTGFFRSTTGAITDQRGMNPTSESLYLGTEIDFIINFRPFSDLGLSLSTGYFLPDNSTDGVYLDDYRKFEFLGKFELSFSF